MLQQGKNSATSLNRRIAPDEQESVPGTSQSPVPGDIHGQSSSSSTEPVLLIIADISGYTRYMTANAKSLAHSHVVIGELVATLVRAVERPLEVAKLEGDAVFLFCRKTHEQSLWLESSGVVVVKLMEFFKTFTSRVAELRASTHCTCNACTHIEKLRLKIVVHSGEALFHQIANFLELAGVDVILIHRLLKNSVRADQYLLLTETAYRDLQFSNDLQFSAGQEEYDDIGRVRTYINVHGAKCDQGTVNALGPRRSLPDAPGNGEPVLSPFRKRFIRNWSFYWKLWRAPLSLLTVRNKYQFSHLANSIPLARQVGLCLLTVLLAPLMLPVGALFVLGRSLREPR